MKNSKVVIGTWPLSGDFGPVGLKKIHEVLEHCYNIGFKEYDTAPNYGNGFMEFCLNKVFHDKPDVKINTKIGNIPFHGKSFDLNDLKRSFEQSLKRLSGLAINVLFLHNPRNEVDDFNPLVDFMNEMKLQGKIKYLGVSRARDFIYDRVLNLNHFDVIQDDMNLLYRPNNFAPNKKFFMARSPLASGILSGKMKFDTAFSQVF